MLAISSACCSVSSPELVRSDTCSEFGVDSENFANKVAKSPTDSLNSLQSIRYGSCSLNVRIEDTQNVLEVIDVLHD